MHLITDDDGDIVAVTTTRRVFLVPSVEALPSGHPRRRLTAALCLYAHAVATGSEPAPFDHERARRYARELLIPAGTLAPGGYDLQEARRLAVPVEVVRERRRDLGHAPCWPSPAVPWASDTEHER